MREIPHSGDTDARLGEPVDAVSRFPDMTKRGNKERKQYLAEQGKIKCGLCPYNDGENRKRQPRPDKYKNHR